MSHRVLLVRHGEPAVDGTLDPGLTEAGHAQAAALPAHLAAAALPAHLAAAALPAHLAAAALPAHVAPAALRTSPLRRARETASPLEAAWHLPAVVDPAFRELPSAHTDVEGRRAWLRFAMACTFAELDDAQRVWRHEIIAAVRALAADTVVTTHAVVINVVTGWCTGDDAVLAWVPAHCSITEVLVDDRGELTLVRRGEGRASGTVV